MKDKLYLENYIYPPRIDFSFEESRLRNLNIGELRKFLTNVFDYPEIIIDYENMKPRDFKRKYIPLTSNKDIHNVSKNFLTKITNFANDNNLSIKYLISKLKEDDILCYKFTVDFKKQNPYEPFVENYFKYLDNDLNFLENFEHLPVGGSRAQYVYRGLICDQSVKSRISETPPSVDFVWEYKFKGKTMKFYASHKYTHGYGTAQKNQMKDLETFLTHSLESALTADNFFIAIMDGNYYTDYSYPNFIGNPRPKVIEHIKATKQNQKCKVATSFDLIEVVINLVEGWLSDKFEKNEIKEEIEKLEIIRNKVN